MDNISPVKQRKIQKAFYAYVGSKLETRDGIQISETKDGKTPQSDLAKAHKLNYFFCNVFTKEAMSSIPTFDQRNFQEKITNIQINK